MQGKWLQTIKKFNITIKQEQAEMYNCYTSQFASIYMWFFTSKKACECVTVIHNMGTL